MLQNHRWQESRWFSNQDQVHNIFTNVDTVTFLIGPLAQVDFRENILNFLEQLVLKRKFGGKGVGSYLILL